EAALHREDSLQVHQRRPAESQDWGQALPDQCISPANLPGLTGPGRRRDRVKATRTDPEDLSTSAFRVLGHPVPQSGMKPVSTAAGPRLVTTGGRDLENWRHSLAAEAAVARVNSRRHVG